MKKLFALLLTAVLSSSPLAVCAEVVAPDVLIKDAVKDVLQTIQQDKDMREGNQKKILALLEEKAFPHFDFTHMTRMGVGIAWRKATPEQQQMLVAQFRDLMVHTYVKSFTVFQDVKVEVEPFKEPSGGREAIVKTKIIRPGAEPLPVDYYVEKTDSGWKAYDVSVDLVRFVVGQRSSCAAVYGRDGIDGLIKALTEQNKAAATASAKKAASK